MSYLTYHVLDMSKNMFWFEEVKTPPFSEGARIEAGFLLRKIQEGEKIDMPYSRQMPSIGKNCHELRINDHQNKVTWRITYHLSEKLIVILDVFKKKKGKTSKHLIEKSNTRLKEFYRIIST